MNTHIKKYFLWLASPLLRQIDKRCESSNLKQSEHLTALKLKLNCLEGELSELSRALAERNNYIDLLNKSGLHEIIACHANPASASPEKVAAVLGDVASTAARMHNQDLVEIARWFATFKAHIRETEFIQTPHAQTFCSSAGSSHEQDAESTALIQRQLEFNAKNSFDRERAASLQIARLTKELELEKQLGLRTLADR